MPSPTSPSDAVQPPEPDESSEQHPNYLLNPLFALVQDSLTGEYYHPSTQYVFADDDADAMTTAAMHSLDLYGVEASDSQGAGARVPDVEVDERYIVVDLALDAQGSTLEIRESTCLSPRWAVADARLRPAPVFGAADDDAGGSMMLVVEGVGLSQDPIGSGGKASKGKKADALLQDARERCGGSVIAGMGDIYASLRSGLRVLDKITETHRLPDQRP